MTRHSFPWPPLSPFALALFQLSISWNRCLRGPVRLWPGLGPFTPCSTRSSEGACQLLKKRVLLCRMHSIIGRVQIGRGAFPAAPTIGGCAGFASFQMEIGFVPGWAPVIAVVAIYLLYTICCQIRLRCLQTVAELAEGPISSASTVAPQRSRIQRSPRSALVSRHMLGPVRE